MLGAGDTLTSTLVMIGSQIWLPLKACLRDHLLRARGPRDNMRETPHVSMIRVVMATVKVHEIVKLSAIEFSRRAMHDTIHLVGP